MLNQVKIGSRTTLFGIFGNPVEHSLSPLIHNSAFQFLGMDSVYLAFRVEPDALSLAFEGMRALGIRGVNLTIPFKEDALNYIDDIPEDLDRLTGAINTVALKDGELLGYNTDGPGFLYALQSELKFSPEGRDVLVLGAGGSARAVVFSLARAHADRIFIYNRTKERAEGLAQYAAQYFPETEIQVIESPEDLPPTKLDLFVNCTPCGLKGNRDLPMDWAVTHEPRAAYDLVYAPQLTPWLEGAKRIGIPYANGLGMLAAQAAISFEIWNGKHENVHQIMLEALRTCRL